ncbi:MAG: cytochrome c [Phycisphaerales bacterium]|nr:cytochrome c [Phycisphaerales bacterium]
MRLRCTIPMLTLIIAAAGCDWMPGKPTKADEPVVPSDVHAFTTLYTNNCSGCHGANGQFGPARPLNDPLYLTLADDSYLIDITSGGVPHTLMPAFAQRDGGGLTESQIKDVINGARRTWGGHAASTESTTPPPLQSETTGDVGRGQSLFATYCGSCHGADGTGGDVAGSVVDSSFLAMASPQALRSTIICGRLDLGMPDYRGHINGKPAPQRAGLTALNDQQVSDITAWILSHRLEYPGAPYPSLKDPPGGETKTP